MPNEKFINCWWKWKENKKYLALKSKKKIIKGYKK